MSNQITKEDVVKFIEEMTVLELSALVKELEETVFDRRKSLVLGKVFAEVVFPLKSNVFHRILIWRIGGKG
jgi:hypothetical protein